MRCEIDFISEAGLGILHLMKGSLCLASHGASGMILMSMCEGGEHSIRDLKTIFSLNY